MTRPGFYMLVLAFTVLVTDAFGASIGIRQADGGSEFTVELGQILDLEVFIDATGEEVTGYSFFISYESSVFSLVPAGFDEKGRPQPFAATSYLGGLPLANGVEELAGETFLSYTEAVGGESRNAATGDGVVARFQLEVARRSVGETTAIRVERRGHSRVSHYVRIDAPGIEQRFTDPLGEAVVTVTGFRIAPPLPDLIVIEGETQQVFDLDDFVDTTFFEVAWTNTRLSEIPTRIDVATKEVTMTPDLKDLEAPWGRFMMIFTALPVGKKSHGEEAAADTVSITVHSRPKISDFPDTLRFAEDSINDDEDVDDHVEDLDHEDDLLTWTASTGVGIAAEIAEASHVLTLSAAPDFFGSETLSVFVEDPTGLRDTASVVVEVTPVNDPPDAKRAEPVYPAEGGEVAVPLTDFFADRDDDVASMQIFIEVEGGVNARIVDGQLVVGGDAAGRGIVHITAQDTSGEIAETRQVAVVLEQGQTIAPEILPQAEQRFLGGQFVELALAEMVIDDSPAQDLIWEAAADSGLAAVIQDGSLLISGESGFSGTSVVRVAVTDPSGNVDQIALNVSVLGPGDDKGPRIFAPGVIGLRPGQDWTAQLDTLVADPDDPDNNITWDIFPTAGLLEDYDPELRLLTLREGETLVEPASLGLVATDPNGNQHSADIPVLLAVDGGPPQIAEFSSVSLDSLNAESVTDLDLFAFDDLDTQRELEWTVAAEPGIVAELDPVTHELKLSRDPDAVDPPAATQVVVRAIDTDGQETSALITVGLPPLFELLLLPDIELSPAQLDSSLVLSDFAVGAGGGPAPALVWRVMPSAVLEVQVDPQSTRVLFGIADAAFLGTEVVEFTATDVTGRERIQRQRVIVKGLGLQPQIRPMPRLQLEMGQVDESIDLDEFVVDDDPDESLQWTASGQRLVTVVIDPESRVITLTAQELETGVDQVQFLVVDPAGNNALAVMEVVVVQGGSAPEINPLPQILIEAGSGEEQMALSPYAADADTPIEDLTWEVQAEPGISARVEGDQLFATVPAGETGSRILTLIARDLQGNIARAELEVLIQQDQVAPEFTIDIDRHPVFGDLMELNIAASEELSANPAVDVDGQPQEVDMLADGSYRVNFAHPPDQQGERLVTIDVVGFDTGGNRGERSQRVVVQWMDKMGGNVRGPDPQLMLNVTDQVAGPGQMAVIYQLGSAELPPDSEGGPVYSVDLLRGRKLDEPVTLNFFPGTNTDPATGILRWDDKIESWREVSARVNPATGWLAASVDELGLFRLGRVEPENRQSAAKLENYPNPYAPGHVGSANITYQIDSPGPVTLTIFNSLGHQVRVLVDAFQEVGVWTAAWDGRDQAGLPVSSGVYRYQLIEGRRRHQSAITLVR